MAKKKKNTPDRKKDEFNHSPFKNLKGLTVSGSPEPEAEHPVEPEQKAPEPDKSPEELFSDEMAFLGVEPVKKEPSDELARSERPAGAGPAPSREKSDEELFLDALGGIQARFEDNYPDPEPSRRSSPGRMKLLKQGRLTPEATLDLHGLKRVEVLDRVRYFLQDACYQGWLTVLIITGRGLHSEDGEPVVRTEVENFLSGDGCPQVLEWARAPKKYGGEGALVLFLKRQKP